VTTKSAKITQGGVVEVGAGDGLRNTEAVRYGGKLAPNLYYRVYAKYFDRNDSVRPNGQNQNNAWHAGQAGFRMDYDPNQTDVLTLHGDLYRGDMSQIGPDDIRVNGGNLLGRWSHKLADNSDMKLQAYYDHTHRRIPGSFTQDIGTYDLDFQHRFPFAANNDIV